MIAGLTEYCLDCNNPLEHGPRGANEATGALRAGPSLTIGGDHDATHYYYQPFGSEGPSMTRHEALTHAAVLRILRPTPEEVLALLQRYLGTPR